MSKFDVIFNADFFISHSPHFLATVSQQLYCNCLLLLGNLGAPPGGYTKVEPLLNKLPNVQSLKELFAY